LPQRYSTAPRGEHQVDSGGKAFPGQTNRLAQHPSDTIPADVIPNQPFANGGTKPGIGQPVETAVDGQPAFGATAAIVKDRPEIGSLVQTSPWG